MYSTFSMPRTLPTASLIEGSPVATATGHPPAILATAAVLPPKNGPTASSVPACSVEGLVPPLPARATTIDPDWSHVKPRGLVRPDATMVPATAVGDACGVAAS